ncbi:uncharacterized protein LOC143281152 [Babylonia areolata]|uniref:uncharacterized protein LOC143281152 n=1 Tax=Babylonia areolata TaxID=304850 RepID=UPI003FD4C031
MEMLSSGKRVRGEKDSWVQTWQSVGRAGESESSVRYRDQDSRQRGRTDRPTTWWDPETKDRPMIQWDPETKDRPSTLWDPETKDRPMTGWDPETKDRPMIQWDPETKDRPSTLWDPETKDRPMTGWDPETKDRQTIGSQREEERRSRISQERRLYQRDSQRWTEDSSSSRNVSDHRGPWDEGDRNSAADTSHPTGQTAGRQCGQDAIHHRGQHKQTGRQDSSEQRSEQRQTGRQNISHQRGGQRKDRQDGSQQKVEHRTGRQTGQNMPDHRDGQRRTDRQDASDHRDGQRRTDRQDASDHRDGQRRTDRQEASDHRDGQRRDRQDASYHRDGQRRDRQDASYHRDGQRRDRQDASYHRDGQRRDRHDVSEERDGQRRDRQDVSDHRDGQNRDRQDASDQRDGQRRNRSTGQDGGGERGDHRADREGADELLAPRNRQMSPGEEMQQFKQFWPLLERQREQDEMSDMSVCSMDSQNRDNLFLMTEEEFRDEMYRRLREELNSDAEEREQRVAKHIREMAKLSPTLFRRFMANNAEHLVAMATKQAQSRQCGDQEGRSEGRQPADCDDGGHSVGPGPPPVSLVSAPPVSIEQLDKVIDALRAGKARCGDRRLEEVRERAHSPTRVLQQVSDFFQVEEEEGGGWEHGGRERLAGRDHHARGQRCGEHEVLRHRPLEVREHSEYPLVRRRPFERDPSEGHPSFEDSSPQQAPPPGQDRRSVPHVENRPPHKADHPLGKSLSSNPPPRNPPLLPDPSLRNPSASLMDVGLCTADRGDADLGVLGAEPHRLPVVAMPPAEFTSYEEKQKEYESWLASLQGGRETGTKPPVGRPQQPVRHGGRHQPMQMLMEAVPQNSILKRAREDSWKPQADRPSTKQQHNKDDNSAKLEGSSASRRRSRTPSSSEPARKRSRKSSTSSVRKEEKTSTESGSSEGHQQPDSRQKTEDTGERQGTTEVGTTRAEELLTRARQLVELQQELDRLVREKEDWLNGAGDPPPPLTPDMVTNTQRQLDITLQMKALREGRTVASLLRDQAAVPTFPSDQRENKKSDPGRIINCCKRCNLVFHSVHEFVSHLASYGHLQNQRPCSHLWQKEALKKYRKGGGARERSQPVKGAEMLVATLALFCPLCCELCADTKVAEAHLKSEQHYNKYQEYLSKHPSYERHYLQECWARKTQATRRIPTGGRRQERRQSMSPDDVIDLTATPPCHSDSEESLADPPTVPSKTSSAGQGMATSGDATCHGALVTTHLAAPSHSAGQSPQGSSTTPTHTTPETGAAPGHTTPTSSIPPASALTHSDSTATTITTQKTVPSAELCHTGTSTLTVDRAAAGGQDMSVHSAKPQSLTPGSSPGTATVCSAARPAELTLYPKAATDMVRKENMPTEKPLSSAVPSPAATVKAGTPNLMSRPTGTPLKKAVTAAARSAVKGGSPKAVTSQTAPKPWPSSASDTHSAASPCPENRPQQGSLPVSGTSSTAASEPTHTATCAKPTSVSVSAKPSPTSAKLSSSAKPLPTSARPSPTTTSSKPSPISAKPSPTTTSAKPVPTTSAKPSPTSARPSPTTTSSKPSPTSAKPSPTTASVKPSPTTTSAKPSPTSAKPSSTTTSAKPSPTNTGAKPLHTTTNAKPSPTSNKPSSTAAGVKLSQTSAKPLSTAASAKPSPTTTSAKPSTTTPRPSPTSAKPSPTTTSAKPSPTTTSAKPSPTTNAKLPPTSAKQSPTTANVKPSLTTSAKPSPTTTSAKPSPTTASAKPTVTASAKPSPTSAKPAVVTASATPSTTKAKPPPTAASAEQTSATAASKPTPSKSVAAASKPTPSKSVAAASKPTPSKSVTAASPTPSKSVAAASKPTPFKSVAAASKPTPSKSVAAASKSVTADSKPTPSKSVTTASPTPSKSVTAASPAPSKSVAAASKPTPSKSVTAASKPAPSKSVTAASKPAPSKSVTAASPTPSKLVTAASKPTPSKSETAASEPTPSKSVTAASEPTSTSATTDSKPTTSTSAAATAISKAAVCDPAPMAGGVEEQVAPVPLSMEEAECSSAPAPHSVTRTSALGEQGQGSSATASPSGSLTSEDHQDREASGMQTSGASSPKPPPARGRGQRQTRLSARLQNTKPGSGEDSPSVVSQPCGGDGDRAQTGQGVDQPVSE